MLSKITIHTASNFKPCIKVVEPKNHYMIDNPPSDDVRDELVRGFRELLHHKSNSAEIIFQNSNSEYIIYPVEDELIYIEKLVMKWIRTGSDSHDKLMEISKMIPVEIEKVMSSF